MTMEASAPALLVVVALVALAASAQAQPGEQEFSAASAQARRGELAGAARAFEAIADGDPTGPWADDALSEAMRAADQAGDLVQARRLGERLLAEYPSSRLARRAQARLDALRRDAGADDRWLATTAARDAIVRAAAGQRDPSPEVRRLEALVLASPGFPGGHDAAMWIGDTWARLGERGLARRWYREAATRAPDDLARWRARKAEADVLAAGADFAEAATIYRALRGTGDRIAERALDTAEAELAIAVDRHRRLRWSWLALAVIGVGAAAVLRRDAGSWRAALRALIRPPIEAVYLAPAAGVLVAFGQTGNRLVADAVVILAVGSLAITWVSGVTLEAARRRRALTVARVALQIAVVVVAVAAVVYVSLMRQRLLDMLVETWKHGHDSL